MGSLDFTGEPLRRLGAGQNKKKSIKSISIKQTDDNRTLILRSLQRRVAEKKWETSFKKNYNETSVQSFLQAPSLQQQHYYSFLRSPDPPPSHSGEQIQKFLVFLLKETETPLLAGLKACDIFYHTCFIFIGEGSDY